MARRVDVVVVGGGVMGLATARALASAGQSVTVLEQFELGHDRGSSHGTSRIFRLSYADPDWVRLALAALPLWRELEEEVGETLLQATGSLDVGGDLGEYAHALAENGVAAELLDSAELRRRFPGLHLPDGQALFHAEGGYVLAERARLALARSAADHGTEVRERTRVTAIEPGDDTVCIRTGAESLDARSVVVAAGSWSKGLLAELGLDLPVTVSRQTVAHFRLAQPNGLPTVIDRGNPPSPEQEAYALPSPAIGLKAGVHRWGQPTDPDVAGLPDQEAAAAATAWVRERYELAEPGPALVETCLYTTTGDERFVLERHGRLVVCSACSGHGFKFAPEIGRRTAALALEPLAD